MYIICFETVCIATWFCSQSSRPRTLTLCTSTTRLRNQTTSRLLSASLYNSWYNLKQNASIVYLDLNTNKTFTKTLTPGHYTLEQLAKIIKKAFTDQSLDLKAELNTINGGLTISNPYTASIQLTDNLSKLLDLGAGFNGIMDVKQLTSPQHLLRALRPN